MPPDWVTRFASREALAGSRRRGANGACGGEVIAGDRYAPAPPAEWPPEQPARELCEPGWSESTGQARVALASFGPRQARELHRRLARWRPAYWPLVLSYLLVLVVTGWFAEPSAGVLAWPLTVVWTWPLFGTLIGIVGIRRTRKRLRKSQARWSGHGLTRSDDFLIVVVSTIGRDDTYPALERSVLSYIGYLPRCFPRLRIDIVIDEGCEATGRIARFAAGSELVGLSLCRCGIALLTERDSRRAPVTIRMSCGSASTRTAATCGCCTWMTTLA